jgi:hypothetical protein
MSRLPAKPESPDAPEPLQSSIVDALARLRALPPPGVSAELTARRTAVHQAHAQAIAAQTRARAALDEAREQRVDQLARGERDRDSERRLDQCASTLSRAERDTLIAAEVVARVDDECARASAAARQHEKAIAREVLDVLLPELGRRCNRVAELHQLLMEVTRRARGDDLGLPPLGCPGFTRRQGGWNAFVEWVGRLRQAGFDMEPPVDGDPLPPPRVLPARDKSPLQGRMTVMIRSYPASRTFGRLKE